ncbi:winged helix-turn-helix domain-containing protein [Vibrio campbellii]|uniref:winged helix-turn-helix domain-containing protein n=1 Tax=Vibrio campbellii TaxID=680 RepID=UPI0005EF678C|nr:winged helix-turn-helix domain-containing protein [Vibrio campbellii]
MSLSYLIAERIVFEPFNNCIYAYRVERTDINKYDIGENSKYILLELINNKSYISKEEFLDNVWRKKRNIEVDDTSVRQAVSKLRRSLKLVAPEIEIIKTIPKKGYRLDVEVKLINKEPRGEVVVKKTKGPRLILLMACAFTVTVSQLVFSHYKRGVEKTPFINLAGVKSFRSGLDVFRPELHRFDEDHIRLAEQCIAKLNLSEADTIVVDTTTKEYLSLTVFYESPIKRHVTIRLVLPKNSGEESYQCDGF